MTSTTAQSVAILGGGPAGLTTAYRLTRQGYRVTIVTPYWGALSLAIILPATLSPSPSSVAITRRKPYCAPSMPTHSNWN